LHHNLVCIITIELGYNNLTPPALPISNSALIFPRTGSTSPPAHHWPPCPYPSGHSNSFPWHSFVCRPLCGRTMWLAGTPPSPLIKPIRLIEMYRLAALSLARGPGHSRWPGADPEFGPCRAFRSGCVSRPRCAYPFEPPRFSAG